MPAEMTLAEIIAEVRRQDANFQTVILKTGHALRLVAVAKAAVEKYAADDALRLERQKTDPDEPIVAEACRRYYAANAALRAAVRGEEGGKANGL